jgi:hypothetical protein
MKMRKEIFKGPNGSLVPEIKGYKRSGNLAPLILNLDIR